MQAELHARRVAADLEDVGGRNRERGPAAAVERIVIRDHRAERVVAAAEVDHYEVARRNPLCERDLAHDLRRREAEGECGDAALDELSSREIHGVPLIELILTGADDQPRQPGNLLLQL